MVKNHPIKRKQEDWEAKRESREKMRLRFFSNLNLYFLVL